MTVDDSLHKLAEIFQERNKLYGDNYKHHGEVMLALFQGEVPKQTTVEDANRFGILTQMVGKLTRYVANWDNGGHEDSLDDLSVYSQMLAEIDREIKNDS